MTKPLQAGVDHAELRRLAEAATPGPWWNGIDDLEGIVAPQNPGGNVVCIPPKRNMYSSLEAWPDNAAYIAAACNAVPALLNEIDALRAAPVLPDRVWRPDREAVAREIVDCVGVGTLGLTFDASLKAAGDIADRILALPDAPAEGTE